MQTKALIDTGCTLTTISEHLAQKLSLVPTGKSLVTGAHGAEMSNEYIVDFTFTGSKIIFPDKRVFGGRFYHPSFDMLIGRDVLSNAVLIYDGLTGDLSMELPSVTHPLDGKGWYEVWIEAEKKSKQKKVAQVKAVKSKKKRARRRADKTSRKKQRPKK